MAGRLAVVGAGLMGGGIAQVAAQAGWNVTVRDLDEGALTRGRDAIRDSLRRFVAKEKISAADADAALDRIRTTVHLEDLADADIVVEAVFERLDVKQDVFRALDKICKDSAVLATNTSAIPVTQIAVATQRPEAVVDRKSVV